MNADPDPRDRTWFHWPRAVVAVVLGEIVPIVALVIVIAVGGPGPEGDVDRFAREAGAWVGPLAGALTLLLVTYWAGIRSGNPVAQGTFIGLAVALLDASLLLGAGEAFRWLFVWSNGGKVVAGAAGGWMAGRRSEPARLGAA